MGEAAASNHLPCQMSNSGFQDRRTSRRGSSSLGETGPAPFQAAGCLCYLRARHRALLCGRGDTGFHRELLAEALRFGLSSALHQSSLYIGKLLVQGAVNTLGTAGAAAYTAAARVEGFANSFGDSGAHALSVFTAQNLGAQKVSRVREGLRQGMLLHLLLGAALSVSMFF